MATKLLTHSSPCYKHCPRSPYLQHHVCTREEESGRRGAHSQLVPGPRCWGREDPARQHQLHIAGTGGALYPFVSLPLAKWDRFQSSQYILLYFFKQMGYVKGSNSSSSDLQAKPKTGLLRFSSAQGHLPGELWTQHRFQLQVQGCGGLCFWISNTLPGDTRPLRAKPASLPGSLSFHPLTQLDLFPDPIQPCFWVGNPLCSNILEETKKRAGEKSAISHHAK